MGDLPTTYEYTGQRNEALIGLYYYRARWYDPALGRFVQADSLVPSPANPMGWDRYAYVLNNPLRFSDPTGHSVDCGLGDPYCRAGKLDTKKRANDLVASYSKKASRTGTTTFYAGLSRDEQRILTEGGWDQAAYNDVYTGTTRDARVWEDPLTYAELAIGAHGLWKIAAIALGPAVKAMPTGVTSTSARPDPRIQRGTTALGSRTDTLWVSQNLPEARTMVDVSNWSARLNIRWLDSAIRRGDEIWLLTDPDTVRPGSFYLEELRYLAHTGYTNVFKWYGGQ